MMAKKLRALLLWLRLRVILRDLALLRGRAPLGYRQTCRRARRLGARILVCEGTLLPHHPQILELEGK